MVNPRLSKIVKLVCLQEHSSCRKLLLFYHCRSCYCFRVRGIVSVVCSIVLVYHRVPSHSCETLRELLRDPMFYA